MEDKYEIPSKTLKIEVMTCAACAKVVEIASKKLKGVSEELFTKLLTIVLVVVYIENCSNNFRINFNRQ